MRVGSLNAARDAKLRAALFLTNGRFCSTYIVVETTFIYFLKDPKNPSKGYVGKSDQPKGRFAYHMRCHDRSPNYRTHWIQALKARGLKPTLEILDEVPVAEWQFWEREYISLFRAIGIKLVNNTDGGDGQEGRKQTPESTAKKRKKHKGSTSKYLGVCWHTKRGKWRADITVSSKGYHVGFFLDEIDAAKAYDAAAKAYCGEHAVLNFP